MKGAIGNAFILNMVITFIIIFFMLLIGSVAYSKAYKTNKFLLDTLVDYVEDFNSTVTVKGKYLNQEYICFDDCNVTSTSWSDRVNQYLTKSGYVLSNVKKSCRSYDDDGYKTVRNTKVGDYDYCIYQKRYYELDELDDVMTKKKYSYKVISYMKFDFPIIGEFIKLPIVSESKVIVNFHDE